MKFIKQAFCLFNKFTWDQILFIIWPFKCNLSTFKVCLFQWKFAFWNGCRHDVTCRKCYVTCVHNIIYDMTFSIEWKCHMIHIDPMLINISHHISISILSFFSTVCFLLCWMFNCLLFPRLPPSLSVSCPHQPLGHLSINLFSCIICVPPFLCTHSKRKAHLSPMQWKTFFIGPEPKGKPWSNITCDIF